MVNLKRASGELFRRSPDECYPSLSALQQHCLWQKQESTEVWYPPRKLGARPIDGEHLVLMAGEEELEFQMNDWSFSQICRLAGVPKGTVNRLSPATAGVVLGETLPSSNRPLQLFEQGGRLRSVHPPSYTRLFNSDLLDVVDEYAVDFEPPPKGLGDATGIYGGEQDMFCFLIDPAGWTEINGEAFAPGFFIWNSEVGSRTVGIETFWFQAVCQNHIVWDAVEVVEFSRKHTANVGESLNEIRGIIEQLVARRDERRDGFARVIERAMQTRIGDDADEVCKVLQQHGIVRTIAERAMEIARQQGGFTIFALVDALTRVAGSLKYAADRTAADQRASRLLTLAV